MASLGHVTHNCTELEQLYLAGCTGITDFSSCLHIRNLHTLNLSHTCIDDSQIFGLNLEHVTHLLLDGVPTVTDLALQYISKQCRQLQTLSLSACTVTDVGLNAFSSAVSSSLSSPSSSSSLPTTIGLPPSFAVRSLNLAKCNLLTDKAIYSIADSMPELRYLDISENGLVGQQSLVHLCNSCMWLSSLRVMHCKKITNFGAEQLEQSYGVHVEWK